MTKHLNGGRCGQYTVRWSYVGVENYVHVWRVVKLDARHRTVSSLTVYRETSDDPSLEERKQTLDHLCKKKSIQRRFTKRARNYGQRSGLKRHAPSKKTTSSRDLEDFARRVQETANNLQWGTFGDRKSFISAVWTVMQEGTLASFKKRLLEAHRKGLVRLHRADLVEEMDPEEVRASHTPYLNADFHFVERK